MAVGEFLPQANAQGIWHLNNSLIDASPNAYTLTDSGGSTNVRGRFGDARNFVAASSQFLSIANASCPNLEVTGSFTYLAWMKPTSASLGTGPGACIMAKSASGTSKGEILYIDPGSNLHLVVYGTNISEVISSDTIGANVWYLAVGRYLLNDNMAIFIIRPDNKFYKKYQSAATGTPAATTAAFNIGAYNSGTTGYFDGIIDEAVMFNKALTDKEIQNYYAWSLGRRSFII